MSDITPSYQLKIAGGGATALQLAVNSNKKLALDGNELPNGSDLDTLKQYVNNTITNFSNNLYPTGSIYITIDKSFNPNNNPIFGTGWVKLPDGYFLSTASNPLINNIQSLPNIKGALVVDSRAASESNKSFTSAFSFLEQNSPYNDASAMLNNKNNDGGVMVFDASKWCNVYQDTVKVKPKSLDVVVWRKGGNISQNYLSYSMKTRYIKQGLLLKGGKMSCGAFVDTMKQLIGDYSTVYLAEPVTLKIDKKQRFFPAGDYIKTTVSCGISAVLFGKDSYHTKSGDDYILSTPSDVRVVRYGDSYSYSITFDDIYIRN